MTLNPVSFLRSSALAISAAVAITSAAAIAPATAQERKLELSANVALTTDYVFRGFSQTQNQAAIQGGFDASYGIFYAGIWGSNLDFADGNATGSTDLELDVYVGIKPKWRGFDLDFGAIYYLYPDANDQAAELDYVEFKAAASRKLTERLTYSSTVYYSPDYTGETDPTWTLESAVEMTLPHKFVFSGTFGSLYYENSASTDYLYWNAGVSRTFYKDKFKLDVRYWDTDLADSACTTGTRVTCDARIVGTLSASF